jgi:hypothetical protein
MHAAATSRRQCCELQQRRYSRTPVREQKRGQDIRTDGERHSENKKTHPARGAGNGNDRGVRDAPNDSLAHVLDVGALLGGRTHAAGTQPARTHTAGSSHAEAGVQRRSKAAARRLLPWRERGGGLGRQRSLQLVGSQGKPAKEPSRSRKNRKTIHASRGRCVWLPNSNAHTHPELFGLALVGPRALHTEAFRNEKSGAHPVLLQRDRVQRVAAGSAGAHAQTKHGTAQHAAKDDTAPKYVSPEVGPRASNSASISSANAR